VESGFCGSSSFTTTPTLFPSSNYSLSIVFNKLNCSYFSLPPQCSFGLLHSCDFVSWSVGWRVFNFVNNCVFQLIQNSQRTYIGGIAKHWQKN
jgi:hypothetical protein